MDLQGKHAEYIPHTRRRDKYYGSSAVGASASSGTPARCLALSGGDTLLEKACGPCSEGAHVGSGRCSSKQAADATSRP